MKKGIIRKEARIANNPSNHLVSSTGLPLVQLGTNILRFRAAFNFVLENKTKISDEMFKTFQSQYSNCLITCAETYLHDYFALASAQNHLMSSKINQFIKKSRKFLNSDDHDEIISKISFQSLENLKDIYNLISENKMLEHVGETNFIFNFDKTIVETNLQNFFGRERDWWNTITEVYKARHFLLT